jgi:hypothetical protein
VVAISSTVAVPSVRPAPGARVALH